MLNTTIAYLIGIALAALGAIHLLPLISAAATGSWQLAGLFLASAVFTIFLAGGFLASARGRLTAPSRMQFIVMIALIWVVLPAVAAAPLYVSGALPTPISAYFEAVSGFTTTGATAIRDLDKLDQSVILWRSSLQWLGGFVTIITVLVSLVPFGISGAPENVHVPGYESGNLGRSARQITTSLLPAYGALTSACFFGLWAGGLPPFDALNIAFSAISTGGFMPRNGGFEIYSAPWAEAVLCVSMILGATSFLAHRAHLRRHFVGGHGENHETRLMLIMCAVLTLVLWVGLVADDAGAAGKTAIAGEAGRSVLETFGVAVFRAISLATTTGFNIHADSYPKVPFVIALLVCFIGGAAFSTAGGIKLYRASLMFRQGTREMERLIYPHGITQARSMGRMIDMQLMKSIWVLSAAFLAAAAISAIALSLEGLSFETSIMAALAALSNVGPALGMSVDGAANVIDYGAMSQASLCVLIVTMVFGRVELLVLLSLGSFAYWRS